MGGEERAPGKKRASRRHERPEQQGGSREDREPRSCVPQQPGRMCAGLGGEREQEDGADQRRGRRQAQRAQ